MAASSDFGALVIPLQAMPAFVPFRESGSHRGRATAAVL
jgi:hypothetical protein